MKKLIILFALALAVQANVFAQKSKKAVKAPAGFEFIPMGTFEYNQEAVSTDAFFICNHEVSNKEYRAFLSDLKGRDAEMYSKCLPDSTLWVKLFEYVYNEPYVAHYHNHPAYADYPVCNITYNAALEYCKWLTEKHNANPKNAKGEFRLPSEYEWVMAARGTNSSWIYAWDTPYLRDKKGAFMANFYPLSSENIKRNKETGKPEIATTIGKSGKEQHSVNPQWDGYYITSPVTSYSKNLFGLYNMCGNVAEMVDGGTITKGGSWHCPGYDIRVDVVKSLPIPSPVVGFRVVFVPVVN
ncbi:MAG TPA: SUMF1/EgtB/PvdO family nonheme iron enzyme [Tenuifilaceae bacterium]|nr:SUMF1/EgtB/PvdO family nonheme iron enzyme [Tenuifilaceae bacterium]